MNYKDPFFCIHYFNGNPVLVRRTDAVAPYTVAIETFINECLGDEFRRTMCLFESAEAASEFVKNSEDAALAFYDSVHAIDEELITT